MDTLLNQRLQFAVDVRFEHEQITIELANGDELSLPLAWYPRLYAAHPLTLTNYYISSNGQLIRWPGLDVDISVKELLRTHSIAC